MSGGLRPDLPFVGVASRAASVRRGILEWIGSAKTAPTRSTRIDETARLAHDNIRANQWPRR